MPAQQRIKLVVYAIQWVLFTEYDPFQDSIDRCKSLVYDFVRRSRDAETARKQANFRNLAKAQLVKILTYHVVPGRAFAKAVAGAKQVKSVEGSPIKITVKKGKVMANEATIIATDINASNGVVHVIDRVIMPPQAKN